DHGEQIVGTHFEDAVHARRGEHDLPRPGIGTTGETGARAADDDARRRRGRDAQGGLDIGDVPGMHHGERASRRSVAAAIGARGLEQLGGGVDDVAEALSQLLDDVHARERWPAMTPAETATTAKAIPSQAWPIDHQAIVTAA